MPQNRPRLLDLFCGAGGCSMGYYRAGFEVVGVDIKPQPHYPFTFIQADAMTYPLDGFDFVHASPPCQAYSISTVHFRLEGKEYPDLLALVRIRLLASGKIWSIENVMGAPVQHGMILCGSMFGLQVRRHRYFETSHLLFAPGPCHHTDNFVTVLSGQVERQKANSLYTGKKCGVASKIKTSYPLEIGQQAMGIDWMNQEELGQAIPPAYTEWIGNQWMDMFRNTRPLSNTNQPGAGLPCGKRTTC